MGSHSSRSTRRQLLLELVMSGAFQTQDALQDALEARGCTATQSSISRDIRALGLLKREGIYVAPRELLAGPAGLKVWQAVSDVVPSGEHMLVVHTLSAMAQAVAAAIDEAEWLGVAGTVAGDDTLLMALSDPTLQSSLLQRLRLLGSRDS